MDKENFEYAMQVYDNKMEEKTHTDKYVHTLYNFIKSAEENNDDIYIGRNEGVFIACRNHSDCTLVIEKFFDINGYEIEKPKNYKHPLTMKKVSYAISRKAYDYLMSDKGSIPIGISTSAMRYNIKYYHCNPAKISAIIVVYDDLVLYIKNYKDNSKDDTKNYKSVKNIKQLNEMLKIEESIDQLFLPEETVYRTEGLNGEFIYVNSSKNSNKKIAIANKFGTIIYKSFDTEIINNILVEHLVGYDWKLVKM